MLKIFFLLIIVFLSSLLLAPMSFSMPLSQNLALMALFTVTNPQPQMELAPTKTVQPSETTQNNQKQDNSAKTLESTSGATPKPTVQGADPQPPQPYDMEKMEKFDQQLYGD
jgi:hypothetical protein